MKYIKQQIISETSQKKTDDEITHLEELSQNYRNILIQLLKDRIPNIPEYHQLITEFEQLLAHLKMQANKLVSKKIHVNDENNHYYSLENIETRLNKLN